MKSSEFPAWGLVDECLRRPVYIYNGARKIVQNVTWNPPSLPTVDLAELGYKPKVKMKALQRMYFNPLEADRLRGLLKHRDGQAFSAVAMSMRGGSKDRRSMGWCMESMVIGYTPKDMTVTMMYRSTEVIKKFSADLAYIPWVFDQLEIKPARVSFFFANAYLSGVFFPTLFRWVDPIKFLKRLKREEPQLFIVATRFLRRSVRNRDQKFPYSPERHQHEFAWKHFPEKMVAIDDYLKQHLGDKYA